MLVELAVCLIVKNYCLEEDEPMIYSLVSSKIVGFRRVFYSMKKVSGSIPV